MKISNRLTQWFSKHFAELLASSTTSAEISVYFLSTWLGAAYFSRSFQAYGDPFDFLAISTSLTGILGIIAVAYGHKTFRRHVMTILASIYLANTLYSLDRGLWPSVIMSLGYAAVACSIMSLMWFRDLLVTSMTTEGADD